MSEETTKAKNPDSRIRTIVFSDRSKGLEGDFPVAVAYQQRYNYPDGQDYNEMVVDPIFDHSVTDNLYGRIMTLVEATTDTNRLKAVKDVFSKELSAWATEVYRSARELANGGDSSENIYTRARR